MNTLLRWTLVSVMSSFLTLVVAPAASADVDQRWKCELEDDASEEDVLALTGEWLKAARQIKGGERFEGRVYFPVAVSDMKGVDFVIVLSAPSFEEWGRFWDSYPDSAAAAIEDRSHAKFVCPDSVLWQSVKVEAN